MDLLSLLGYAASILVALSLMMGSIVKLRVLNLIGALAFAVYGGLVGAYPVLAVNAFIVVVNLFYLSRLSRFEPAFELLEIEQLKSRYLHRFLDHHAQDIAHFFPCFERARLDLEGIRAVYILRDMIPVGLVVCRPIDDEVIIELDYVIPSHRDLRCARYFYREFSPCYAARGLKRFAAHAANAAHRRYLLRLGFTPDLARGEGFYQRAITPSALKAGA
ncbi:YgjV family protein [Myxococcota bacterium]|nr:YgjV family protein [Myxococcota bacterium]MBU1897284.1 YgjV family protein [Myxococcota bacterium]